MIHRKKTNDALWFAETYGLMPESLVLRDDSGQLHTVEINGSSSSSSCTEGNQTCYWSAFQLHFRISNITCSHALISGGSSHRGGFQRGPELIFVFKQIIISFIFFTIDKKCQTYESLPPEEQKKIKSILYIMDKFSVSQEAYHELTQQDPALPRSYLVKACHL